MVERVPVLFQSSPEFKEAIATYAQQHRLSASEVMRVAIAQYIGYDISSDSISGGRPKIYANKEERIKAQNDRAKQQRENLKTLMDDFHRAVRRGDVKTMEEWVEMRKREGLWQGGDD